MASYVQKPLLWREGANVTLVTPAKTIKTAGDYGAEGFVYQETAGIGIRESDGPITNNLSRFVPHVIE